MTPRAGKCVIQPETEGDEQRGGERVTGQNTHGDGEVGASGASRVIMGYYALFKLKGAVPLFPLACFTKLDGFLKELSASRRLRC